MTSDRWHDSSGYGPTRLGLAPVKEDTQIKSGWCMSGSHEGLPKKVANGSTLPECTFPDHCKCDCHARERELRELMGQPAPVYAPPGAPIPVRVGIITDISGSLFTTTPDTAEIISTPAREVTLKSRLEWKVWEVAQRYMEVRMHETDLMTVAFFCSQLEGTSSGAIDSVLKRWESTGFCTLGRKPTRFTGLTERGSVLGLEEFIRKTKVRRK